MKRPPKLVRIFVFLLLGAIVNVAVAWGFAMWSPIGLQLVDLPTSSGWKTKWVGEGRGVSLLAFDVPFASDGELLAGWPCLSAGYSRVQGRPRGTGAFNSTVYLHEFAPSDGVQVPLRPIWPGFAINTVFYSVALWLLFAGPFVVRRWRRIRRGLCPKCAYDLRGSSAGTTCPECGQAVAS